MGFGRWILLLAGLAWVGAGEASAQVRAPGSPSAEVETTIPGALARLAARAGLVFVGTVEAINRTPGVVEVSLRVEQVLQGQPGSLYVLREWAGRWPPGLVRYTIGQRALFFLNAPGPSGLSSPVDGGDGVVPVFGDAAGGAALGIERLNATLLRQVGDKLSDAKTFSLRDAAQAIVNSAQPGFHRPASGSGEQPVPIVVRGSVSARSVEVAHGSR